MFSISIIIPKFRYWQIFRHCDLHLNLSIIRHCRFTHGCGAAYIHYIKAVLLLFDFQYEVGINYLASTGEWCWGAFIIHARASRVIDPGVGVDRTFIDGTSTRLSIHFMHSGFCVRCEDFALISICMRDMWVCGQHNSHLLTCAHKVCVDDTPRLGVHQATHASKCDLVYEARMECVCFMYSHSNTHVFEDCFAILLCWVRINFDKTCLNNRALTNAYVNWVSLLRQRNSKESVYSIRNTILTCSNTCARASWLATTTAP